MTLSDHTWKQAHAKLAEQTAQKLLQNEETRAQFTGGVVHFSCPSCNL